MATHANALANALYSGYRFEIKNSRDGQFYWILHNTRGNTEPFAQSETYTTKENCIRSIDLVKAQAASATTHDNTAPGGLLNSLTIGRRP
jgi:uncharacterized protein YegP (UPF0339 family)